MTNETDPQSDLRGKLLKRLAMAGVLVAVLLGVLAFFDYLSTAPEEPEAPVYRQPVPVPPKKEMTQPVTPAVEAPEPAKPEAPPPAAPEPPPAKPEVAAPPAQASVPAEPVRPAAKAAPVRSAPPGRPVSSPGPSAEGTSAPQVTVPDEAAAAAPAPKTVEASPPRPALTRLMAGYSLQAGVFASAQRAEELHAKLTLNGIPSTLEARVQVGPFKTRQEAEAAREKMKALGIDAVMIPPAKR